MAYTLMNAAGECQPLRLIAPDVNGEPVLKAPFTPYHWVCDPCNPPERRYEVTYGKGYQPQGLRWFEVVLHDETESDIAVKLKHYRDVLYAQKLVDIATRKLNRLMRGW